MKSIKIKILAILVAIAGITATVAMKGGDQKNSKKFMVSISYDKNPEKEFNDLIPAEKIKFKELKKSGHIIDGYVTPDHTRGWLILKVSTEADAKKAIETLPMYKKMKVEYIELAPFSKYWHF